MQYANRKRVIKLARQGQTIDVGLNHVRVWQRTRRSVGSLNRFTQIDANNFTRAPPRRELRVTSLSAPAFKHDLVAEKLRRNRRNPTQKLLGVPFVFLGEVPPLPTEIFRRRLLVSRNRSELGKTWNAARYRKRRSAGSATQLTFNDLGILCP